MADVSEEECKEIRDDESKYLKAEYPQIAFSKAIKARPWKVLTYFKSQKDLEETLVSLTRKGKSTKWSFRSFKEVKEQLEKKGKEALFERQERNLSLGSVDSDKIQDRFELALDGLVEKENELRKEVTHPSVEPEEVEKLFIQFETFLQWIPIPTKYYLILFSIRFNYFKHLLRRREKYELIIYSIGTTNNHVISRSQKMKKIGESNQ